MANVKLVFKGNQCNEEHELECFATNENEIFISIDNGLHHPSWICLDESTSIKLAKTLRTEINKIKEVNNA